MSATSFAGRAPRAALPTSILEIGTLFSHSTLTLTSLLRLDTTYSMRCRLKPVVKLKQPVAPKTLSSAAALNAAWADFPMPTDFMAEDLGSLPQSMDWLNSADLAVSPAVFFLLLHITSRCSNRTAALCNPVYQADAGCRYRRFLESTKYAENGCGLGGQKNYRGSEVEI